jgi:ATP-dependent DNA helicase RecQ
MVTEKIIRNHGRRIDNDAYLRGYKELPRILQLMGYPGLRKGQEEMVLNAISLRDTLGFLPTGAGKTAIFVIPALCLEMRALIFSPLVALMQDQVQNLWKRGIKAGQVSGLQSDSANADTLVRWMRGEIMFLYVAPERLRNEQFMQAMRERSPEIVVVDEAHTISQWVDTFRPAYGKIGSFIRNFNPRVVLALTATATEEIEHDIRETLGIQDAERISYLPERSNLKLSSTNHPGELGLSKMLAEVEGPAIVYCATVREVETLGANLSNMLPGQVTVFHGQLDAAAKKTSQELFMQDQQPYMVATNAFGMGIDKPNIRAVFHHDMPGTIEALVQETGRAGRDGLESKCVTLFREKSLHTQRFFIDCSYPSEKMVRQVFKTLQQATPNPRGEIMLTVKDIAVKAGDPWAEQKVNACLNILVRAGAIERQRSENKVGKVMYNTHVDHPRFQEYYSVFKNIGNRDSDGMLCFDLDLAAVKIGVSLPSVTKNLKQWQADGLLTYIPPFRGVPTKVTGSVDDVNFPRLAEKYREAAAKLQKMQDYFSVPDHLKHTFLKEYFALASG